MDLQLALSVASHMQKQQRRWSYSSPQLLSTLLAVRKTKFNKHTIWNKLFLTANGQKFNSAFFGKLLPRWNLSYNIGFKHTWCHNMFFCSLWEEQNSFNKFIWKLYNFGVKRECISMNDKLNINTAHYLAA